MHVSVVAAGVGGEAAAFEEFDETGGFRVRACAVVVRVRNADHRRIAAQEDVRLPRIERVAEFGFEVHPKYGTKVPQNGIVVAAPLGTEIEATAEGVVEFVDWYDGYGRTVILNHGGGYYSLYAHASAVLVRRGDRVSAGDVIAKVGDTDSIRGSCLHFELRHSEEALNPRQWLRAGE